MKLWKLSGIALALAAVMSPTAATAEEGVGRLEEVVVYGIRNSLASAIEEKRNSDNLIEVINAEDIGKLPDQNLAEVLENVTGIQITREAGVGTGVQIRGTNSNRTVFNGVSTMGSGGGRSGIDFEDVAASIISSVEVIKAPDASTIEGSVGGTINLRTVRPLELREQLAAVRVQGEYSSLAEDDDPSPRVSGTWGNNWSTDMGEIGVVLSGSWNEQDVRAFRPRTDRDNFVGANEGRASSQAFDFLPIQFLIQDYDNFNYETTNFAGTFEWAPNDNLRFYFDAIINDQERLQESYRVQASGVSDLRDIQAPDTFQTVNFSGIGSIEAALTGTIPIEAGDADPNLRASTDTSSRESESQVFRVGGDWIHDRWSGTVEYSHSSNETETPAFNTTLNFINPNVAANTSNENGTPFVYDLTGGSLTWAIDQSNPLAPTDAQLLDPANYVLRDANVNLDTAENEETAFRFDVSYDLDWNGITTIDAGYRYHERTSENVDIRANSGIRAAVDAPSADRFAGLLSRIPDNYDDADGRDLFVDTLLIIDPGQALSDPAGTIAALDAAKAAHIAVTGGSGTSRADPIGQPTSLQNAFFDIEEETNAVYGQINFDYGMFRGNAGFRYIQTDVASTGNAILNGVATPTTTEGDYSFWLPRVNLVVEPREDVLIRASWSRDINRPNFADLSTSTTFSTSPNPAVAIGNPALEPEEVESFDLGVEWYFTEGAVVSIAYFHKKREGLFTDIVDQPFEDPTTGFRDITDPCEQGGIFNPIADINVFGPVGVGVCVPAATTFNGNGDTTQKGVEIAFQYDLSQFEDELGWAAGFGIAANYTHQEFDGNGDVRNPTSRADEVFTALGQPNYTQEVTLTDLSENAYNITLYYERFGLSARARYTWREAYRSEDFGSTSSLPWGFPVVQEDRGQLNASITYDVNDHLNIGIEAVNITEEEVEQSCVNEGGLLCFQGFTDRRITVGASYRF